MIAIDGRNADEIHECFPSFLSVLNYEEDWFDSLRFSCSTTSSTTVEVFSETLRLSC